MNWIISKIQRKMISLTSRKKTKGTKFMKNKEKK